jgi:hypothetical protein
MWAQLGQDMARCKVRDLDADLDAGPDLDLDDELGWHERRSARGGRAWVRGRPPLPPLSGGSHTGTPLLHAPANHTTFPGAPCSPFAPESHQGPQVRTVSPESLRLGPIFREPAGLRLGSHPPE